MHPRGVIVTRPEPGLSETMAAVADAGWLPLASPALVVQRHTLRLPQNYPQLYYLPVGRLFLLRLQRHSRPKCWIYRFMR